MALQLPLFPLQTVLFPGQLLPVHVFEERYRRLVADLLELPAGPARRFGVVAIRTGQEVGPDAAHALYDVGCTAQLREVRPHPDGRYDLVTTGVTRFRLLEVEPGRPYRTAQVELLPERVGADPEPLLAAVTAQFRRYLELLAAVSGGRIDPPELPADPLVVSYLVAATMIAPVADRFRLLAADDATERLALELSLLRREAAVLATLSAPPATDLAGKPRSLN